MILYAIATILTLAAVVIGVIRGIARYRAAAGTPQQRLSLLFRNAETILLAFVQALIAAVLAGVRFFADFFNDPAIADAFHGLVKADYLPFYLAGIAAITYIARMVRTQPNPVTGAIDPPPPDPKPAG